MARPLRIVYPGAFYHVTSRGNERKVVFKSMRDREKFFEYLATATQRYYAVIHSFCLMDNHYHLLIETPSGNLPQIMHHINGAYTIYFNVKRARSGHLFQGRYKAVLVDIDEYAKELSRYIHLNPVRAKMVEVPEAYDWSSYNFYIGEKKPPEWLYRDFILGYFGSKVSVAQDRYRQFVSSMANKNYDNPMKDATSSVLLGSQDFIKFVRKNFLVNQKPDKDLPALRELTSSLSMQDIFYEVEAVFGKDSVLSKNIKMYLCRNHTAEKLKTIGSQFGIGESAVSHACRKVQLKIEEDRKLKKKTEELEKRLMRSRIKT